MNCEIKNPWICLEVQSIYLSSPQFVSVETETKRGEGICTNTHHHLMLHHKQDPALGVRKEVKHFI